MSGLETVASFIAICTVSYQILSSLCDAIQDLKTVLKELDSFKQETKILQRSIEQVIHLAKTHDETLDLFHRFGLQDAILTCATVCEEFRRTVAHWRTYPDESRRARVQAWYHKKNIQHIRREVSSAREVTAFALNSVQLHLLVRSSIPSKETPEKMQSAEAELQSTSTRQGMKTKKHNRNRKGIDLRPSQEDLGQALVITNGNRPMSDNAQRHKTNVPSETRDTDTQRQAEKSLEDDRKAVTGATELVVGDTKLKGSGHTIGNIVQRLGGGKISAKMGKIETDDKSSNTTAFNITYR